MSTSHTYTPKDLQREARGLCKGFGRFIGWEIELTARHHRPPGADRVQVFQ